MRIAGDCSCSDAPAIDGAVEVLRDLNDRYDVFIVSSATQFPNSLEEKVDWLNEHFAFISWKQLVLCGSKSVVRGDIMIDDHLMNLNGFDGRTLLFTQPHNAAANGHGHERVSGWHEVAALLG